MINRIVLVGRITKDPELKYSSSNLAVCNYTIAVNRIGTNKQGEREADFINCVVFDKQAENLARFIKKGGLLGVEGRLQTRTYTAQDGSTRYVTEVVSENIQFLEPKGDSSSDYSTRQQSVQAPRPQQQIQQPRQVAQVEAPKDPFFDAEDNFAKVDLDIEEDLPF